MNKFSFLIVFVGILVADIVSGIFLMDKPIMDKCKKIEGATDADLSLIHQRKSNLSPTGKRLLACTFEESGIISPNGQVSLETLISFITLRYGSDEKAVKTIAKVAELCTSLVADVNERGELATELRKCVLTNAEKEGLDTLHPWLHIHTQENRN